MPLRQHIRRRLTVVSDFSMLMPIQSICAFGSCHFPGMNVLDAFGNRESGNDKLPDSHGLIPRHSALGSEAVDEVNRTNTAIAQPDIV